MPDTLTRILSLSWVVLIVLFNLGVIQYLMIRLSYGRSVNISNASTKKLLEILPLSPGQKILNIGSSWGSFMFTLPREYRISIIGTEMLPAQAILTRLISTFRNLFHNKIEVQVRQYMRIELESFDMIIINLALKTDQEIIQKLMNSTYKPDAFIAVLNTTLPISALKEVKVKEGIYRIYSAKSFNKSKSRT